jgi:putative transferase (TIGR04331 family)
MLLVTTALESSWGQDEPLLFLGEWCLLYHRRKIAAGRDYDVVRNHWDDRGKLELDEANLTALHDRLISALAIVLNKIHGLNYDDSYWRMLLDPWLVSYTAVIWDRWECMRIALDEYRPDKTFYLASQSLSLVPRDYPTSVEMFLSDQWNHELFKSILVYRDDLTCEVVELDTRAVIDHTKNVEVTSNPTSLKWRFAKAIDKRFNFLSSSINKVALVGNIFSPLPQALLNLRLGQIPSFYWSTFDDPRPVYAEAQDDLRASASNLLENNFSTNNDFEKFLRNRFFKDAPNGILESFASLRNDALKLALEPNVIVTSYFHWGSDPFKVWVAEKIVRGSKFVVVEHGGSIHPRFDTMNFEDEIVSNRITWCAPYKQNQTQLPPSKLVIRSEGTSGEWCTIVGYENPRYVYRATAAPHVAQCLTGFLMICQLVDRLDGELKAAVRFKPYVDMGWSL